jgi:diphthamide synthase subunit DPH2
MSIKIQLIENLVIVACVMVGYIWVTLRILRWLLRPKEADVVLKEKEN